MAKHGKVLRSAIAVNIRRARLARGWSQEVLAQKASRHRTLIGHVERADTNISIDCLEQLAEALEMPAAELLKTDAPHGVSPNPRDPTVA